MSLGAQFALIRECMKIAFVIGWLFWALEAVFVGSMFVSKNVGNDASGRGMATGFGMVLLPALLLAGGLLLWAQSSSSRGLQYAGLLVVSIPFLVGGGLWVSNELNERKNGWSRDQAGRFRDSRLSKIGQALDGKDYAAVEALLQQSPAVDWTAEDAHGKTLLEHAVGRVLADYSGDASAEGVAILLAKGAPIPKAELVEMIFEGNAPGAVALLGVVLKAGVDANSKDHLGEPLVHLKHAFRGVEKLKLLAEHGADLTVVSNRTDRPRWSALMTAIDMRSWESAVFLLAHGRSPEYRALDGKSAASLLEERVVADAMDGRDPEPAFLVLRREMAKYGLSEPGR